MQRKDTLATIRPDSAGLKQICIACSFFLYREEENNWATGCMIEDSWFSSGQVQQIFLFSRTSRRILGPMWWLLGALSPGVKQAWREGGHPYLVRRLRIRAAVPPLLPTPSCRGAEVSTEQIFLCI